MSRLVIERLNVAIGGKQLLSDVSLTLHAGEPAGLIGESGSGKSLCALAILGLLPAGMQRSGSIRLDGVELADKSEREMSSIRGKDIGIVFQEPMTALNPIVSIGDQVAETFRRHLGLSRRAARAAAAGALERVELPERIVSADRYPHELSGGQRQRVAIAIAIALQPKLLIADEPTTALDGITQAQILRLLSGLAAETGAGLLFVSHDLAAVARVARRVAVISAGRIVEEGPIGLLAGGFRHPVTAGLVAAAKRASLRTVRPLLERAPQGRGLSACGIRYAYPGVGQGLFGSRPAQPAVDDVSLRVAPRESVGLIGASGSGKTTILRALLGLIRPQGGDVLIDGESFVHAGRQTNRRLRRKIQIVFQDPAGSFDPRWRVEDLVAEPLALLDEPLSRLERRRRVEALLELTGLKGRDAERFPHEFSGGERQRIALARALIVDPEIVVFDEATSALDISVKGQILDLLVAIAAQRDISYLFVTHDLSLVRAMTHRVVVLEAGRAIEEGPTDQVFRAPQHPYTAQLIAAAPSLDEALSGQARAAAATIA
jgi:peptide/nickel transport system ATP-binding protein